MSSSVGITSAGITSRRVPIPNDVIESMILPWWRNRLHTLTGVLERMLGEMEAADAAGTPLPRVGPTADFDGRRRSQQWLIDATEDAATQVIYLETRLVNGKK